MFVVCLAGLAGWLLVVRLVARCWLFFLVDCLAGRLAGLIFCWLVVLFVLVVLLVWLVASLFGLDVIVYVASVSLKDSQHTGRFSFVGHGE